MPAEKLSPNGWKAVIDIVLNGTFFAAMQWGITDSSKEKGKYD